MHTHRTASSFVLALLATTMLTEPGPASAAPGDALGPEFRANTFTDSTQESAAVAMDADGDFVVAWTTNGRDGSSYGISARRFDAAGAALGPEFLVNSFTTGRQVSPAVAMDTAGNFVVVWADFDGQDGIFAQRFDAAGMDRGPEFRVNAFTTFTNNSPAVAMDADGDFVVAWTSYGRDGNGAGIFAQRFGAAGVAQGSEFQVNGFTTGRQVSPAVAMDADGDFVVVWRSYGQDGSRYGVFAQRFDAAGTASGPEFQVNTFTANSQSLQAVAMDADGDFIVAWASRNQDDPNDQTVAGAYGVFAQRFDAAGAAQGPEFQVNTFTRGSQWETAVAMDADGDFVVAWTSVFKEGGYLGIFAQRYTAAGVALGVEFQVNTFTTNNQRYPAVAMDADGDFVVAWQSYGQDGDRYGVFAQRYDGAERIEGDFDGDGNADLLWRNTDSGNTILWLMEGTRKRAAQLIGTVPVVWQIAGTGDFNGDGKADVLWRHTTNGAMVLWQMDGFEKVDAAPIGRPPLVWVVEQLRDTDGDGNSDIFWRNSTTGDTVIWRMSGFDKTIVGAPGAAGPLWEVR